MAVSSKVSRTPVSLVAIKINPYKGKFQAEIVQTVTTETKYTSEGLGDNPFMEVKASRDYSSSKTLRAWNDLDTVAPVPANDPPSQEDMQILKDATFREFERVGALLAKLTKAGIVEHLSLNPILSDADKGIIKTGLRTLDQFAEKQLLRARIDVNGTPVEKLILLNGAPCYRRTYFTSDFQGDKDTRLAELGKVAEPSAYIKAIVAEYVSQNRVINNQSSVMISDAAKVEALSAETAFAN